MGDIVRDTCILSGSTAGKVTFFHPFFEEFKALLETHGHEQRQLSIARLQNYITSTFLFTALKNIEKRWRKRNFSEAR